MGNGYLPTPASPSGDMTTVEMTHIEVAMAIEHTHFPNEKQFASPIIEPSALIEPPASYGALYDFSEPKEEPVFPDIDDLSIPHIQMPDIEQTNIEEV